MDLTTSAGFGSVVKSWSITPRTDNPEVTHDLRFTLPDDIPLPDLMGNEGISHVKVNSGAFAFFREIPRVTPVAGGLDILHRNGPGTTEYLWRYVPTIHKDLLKQYKQN